MSFDRNSSGQLMPAVYFCPLFLTQSSRPTLKNYIAREPSFLWGAWGSPGGEPRPSQKGPVTTITAGTQYVWISRPSTPLDLRLLDTLCGFSCRDTFIRGQVGTLIWWCSVWVMKEFDVWIWNNVQLWMIDSC